jgi:hypothetical protein
MRAGTLDAASFRVTPDGLYGEGVLDENMAGDTCLALIEAGDAAWSTGALPQRVKVREDGYVQEWPLMEASIAPAEMVVSQRGTTRAIHIRSFVTDVTANDDDYLARSLWMMSDQANGAAPTLPPPLPAPAPAALTAEQVRQIVTEVVQAQPTRTLPANGQNPVTERQPQIRVSSKYDDVSLLGLCFWDEMNRLYNHTRGRTWVREEAFMRALAEKMVTTKKAEDAAAAAVVLPENHIHFRAVDDMAFNAWHKYVPHLRANELMQSTLSSYGDELVPTVLSSSVWLGFRMATKVFGALSAIRPPSNPYNFPTITAAPITRRVLESTAQSQMSLTATPYTVSKPTTANITFNALGKIGAMSLISYELFRDAGINLADAMSERFVRAMADAVDWTLINGDESATATNISHYGTDPTATAYDQALLMDGLRHLAIGDSASGAVATADKSYLNTIRKKMGTRGRIGSDTKNLIAVVDPGVYYKLIEVSEVLTVQNYGSDATIRTGEIGSLTGVPIIVSDQLEYANASGQVEDSHDGTVGTALTIHTDMVKVAVWRDVEVIKWDVPEADAFAIKGSVALDINRMEAGAVAYGYNTTV